MSHRCGAFGILKLLEISRLKFFETLWDMPVPLAERIRRGNRRTPLVEVGSHLAYAAWPDPVDQHTNTIVITGIVVNSSKTDVQSCGQARTSKHFCRRPVDRLGVVVDSPTVMIAHHEPIRLRWGSDVNAPRTLPHGGKRGTGRCPTHSAVGRATH